MRLITEQIEDVRVELVEDSNGGAKKFCIEGIFLQGGIKNRNGRVYPERILEQEVGRYVAERVSKGRAYGELGHPSGPQINLERVSHMITSLKPDGRGNYIGKAVVTEGTPYGAIVKGLLEAGANLGVSSRGLGSLKNVNGIMEVQNDFRLATAADVVADPSAPDAFVNGIMEGTEWVYDDRHGWRAQEIVEDARKSQAHKLSESEKFKLFQDFLNEIKV